MSNSINFNLANFAFTAEQIRDINELVYEGIEKLPELSAIHQFYRGIIYDKEVGFITGGGLVGKKGQGCDPQTQDWRVSTRKVLWQPKEWEIFLDECADDLKNTMVLYAMNQGTRVDDLTDTDYMAIVVEVLIGAVYKFIYRLIWMSDTDADNVDFETLNVAALATLTAVPTAAATEQTTGSPLVGDVYEVSTADDKVKCALADGTVIYLAAEKSTGNAVADKTYYSMDAENKITPIEGTVYMGVAKGTQGAQKCTLSNGTIVYLAADAATGVAQEGKTYYSKDTENTVTINGGGYITEDVDPEYFDIIDGLFKQLRGLVAEDNTRGVTITANSKTSKADQMGEMTADRAYTLLSDMWYKAPIKLRQMKADTNVENRPKFLVTQSIADAYEQYLIGKGIDRTYVNLVEGVQVLSFLGVPVVPMAIWDEMIQAYNDLGDTYFKPHRALLTTKSVLAVGTPNGEREFGEFDIWYDKTSRKNYILLKDKLDAKIANPDHFIYAE
jgi:hypothetical protein